MAFQTGGNRSSLSDINITPLVDVMLVLLVIFMVTAPMMSSTKANTKPPTVDTNETVEIQDNDLAFEIGLDRKIRYFNCKDCKPMTLETIVTMLRGSPKVKEKRKAFLFADKRLKYRYVLQVMARMGEAGIKKVALVTDPSGRKTRQTK